MREAGDRILFNAAEQPLTQIGFVFRTPESVLGAIEAYRAQADALFAQAGPGGPLDGPTTQEKQRAFQRATDLMEISRKLVDFMPEQPDDAFDAFLLGLPPAA
jgi:hypothetical protein